MKIQFFDQKLPFFLEHLPVATLAKVLRAIDLLEIFGSQVGMPHSKKISKRLFELRVRGVLEVRIIYVFDKNQIVLLHGFIKKTNKIPQKELDIANRRLHQLDLL
jgi:phage-related protein